MSREKFTRENKNIPSFQNSLFINCNNSILTRIVVSYKTLYIKDWNWNLRLVKIENYYYALFRCIIKRRNKIIKHMYVCMTSSGLLSRLFLFFFFASFFSSSQLEEKFLSMTRPLLSRILRIIGSSTHTNAKIDGYRIAPTKIFIRLLQDDDNDGVVDDLIIS